MAEAKTKALTPEEIAQQAAEKEKKHREELEAYYNEKVEVYVHKPEYETENSVTVTHNGRNWQIMYNKRVTVPRYIALIIEESERNREIANAEAEKLSKTQKLRDF